MTYLNSKNLNLMDDKLHEFYSREDLPGIAAVITYRQETIWSGGHGFADLDSKKPADLNTIYHLGSVTKLFTAMMLMQLRDAGKLHLDDVLD